MENKLNNQKYLDTFFTLISIVSIIFFYAIETNRFFEIAIAIILAYSLWQLFKKDNSPFLFVIGFIINSVLFYYSEIKTINITSASILIFAVILFLFSYRHKKITHIVKPKIIFNIYTILLGMLVAELFYILTFFEIASKNKAILVILFMWFYDEIYESYEQGKLTKKFTASVSLIFLVVFIILSLTFPFKLV